MQKGDPINIDLKGREPPAYIAIEGPIGVGKTTLAHLLAQSFNYEILLEDSEQNPFLKDFYKNPEQSALATQLFFLFQRVQKYVVENAEQTPNHSAIHGTGHDGGEFLFFPKS